MNTATSTAQNPSLATSRSTHFSKITQAFHWLTALVVIAAFALGLGGPEHSVYSAERLLERQWHETLGFTVFALTLLRLVWKLFDKAPAAIPMATWMSKTSKIVQVLLYVLLIAVPVTAVLGAWWGGHSLNFLASINVSPAIAASANLGENISELHTLLGDAIVWLAGLHAAAAIYHYVFLKDGVLQSMAPSWLPLRPSK